MLERLTDFEPCCARIHAEFGRLIPIGVAGEASPVSDTTMMALPVIPVTSAFLCSGMIGELSSNHCAYPAIAPMRLVASTSRTETTDSYEPRNPSGSL